MLQGSINLIKKVNATVLHIKYITMSLPDTLHCA